MRCSRFSLCFRWLCSVAAFAGAILGGAPRPALAVQYRIPILVTTVDDLRDLFENGDIDEDELEILAALLERPLDLNRARREALHDLPGLTWPMVDAIIAYREETSPFRDVADLADAGIPAEVVREIRPFARVAKRLQRPPAVRGSAQLRGLEEFKDGRGPSFALRGRATIKDFVQLGVTGLVQDRTGPFHTHHETGLTWVSAKPASTSFWVPKGYAFIDQPNWQAIVGSYQVGFGERLTFDETTRSQPNGIYPDDLLVEYVESGKFGVRERLFGVAGAALGIPLGNSGQTLDVTAFFSWFPYDISQSGVDSRQRATDDTRYFPRGGSNPLMCDSDAEPSACGEFGVGKISFQTLRAAYTELLFGGRVAYNPLPRWRIGTTFYFSFLDWQAGTGMEFAPSARYPNRDRFGAAGIDLAGHIGPFSVFGEYSATFAGGHAAVLRGIVGFRMVDVEVAGRYYGQSFDNPHARGTAAADQYLGQRDRDETGGLLRVNVRPWKSLQVRLDLDLWHRPSLGVTSLDMATRVSIDPLPWMNVAAGVDFTDKDLTVGGRNQNYMTALLLTDDPLDESLQPYPAGARVAAWGQIVADVLPKVRLLAFYKSIWWDTTRATGDAAGYYQDHFAHDHYVYLLASVGLIKNLILSTRFKYADQQTRFGWIGESYVEGWVQLRWRIIPAVALQLRYRVRGYVDDRDSTQLLAMNPQHLIRGTLDVTF